MIQELLGGLVEERKISIPSLVLDHTPNSISSNTNNSSSSSPATSTTDHQQQQPQQQNLKCPRCDSPNTKFCYYNNYNLTQPRYFCKTCRRYWTKGGALRNVPIGGGCRKAKVIPTFTTPCIASKSAENVKISKPVSAASELLARSGLVGRFNTDLPSSPVLWASPHTSHLMSLLRSSNAAENPNHTLNSTINVNSVRTKENSSGILNSNSLGFDHIFSQVPNLNVNSLWKHSDHYTVQHLNQQQSNNILLGEMPSLGMIHHDQYQRFKSNDNCYSDHQLHTVMSNRFASIDHSNSRPSAVAATATMTTSVTTSIIEPSTMASAGDFGYWNPALSWPDLPTTNGAFS